MATTNVKFYSLGYGEIKTYLTAVAFVVGNITLPQLFHLLHSGGTMWLPIYFFTLIAAYKYGWRTGLLTALLSPLANYLLFGMPGVEMLAIIGIKSSLIALAAGYAAWRYERVSIPILAGVTIAYQTVGTLAQWAVMGSFTIAIHDLAIAIPGVVLQILGGWLFIKYLLRK